MKVCSVSRTLLARSASGFRFWSVLPFLALVCLLAQPVSAAETRVVLVAGVPSHGPGEHEHRAGCLLIKKCLDQLPGVSSVVYTNGWPTDPKAFDGAETVLFYADGGGGHPAIQGDRLKVLGEVMRRGAGIVCVHYAVEVPKERGGAEFLSWMGGYFEMHWSVNPHWDAGFTNFPNHPVARGLKPFTLRDEWYYHMRFPEGMKGVTPILTALPPASTLDRQDGPHSGNPAVREAVARGEPQHVAWAFERPNGGRGFGFTGAHFHRNWGDENFRKLVLNAILWTARKDVPAGGVVSQLADEDLKANLDSKRR